MLSRTPNQGGLLLKLLLGNEAVALGAYEAGAKVASAYPGTPSTEITESLARFDKDDIYVEWAPNEKVALEVCIGASMAGVRAICSMKHVGLNVAADPLFTASYIGVSGGLVICVADDQGMHSSQNEQDSRHYAKASKTLMLEPSDSAECRDFVKLAFELGERFDTPVLLRLSTRVSHSRSLVEEGDREEKEIKAYAKNPGKHVMMPGMARLRHVVVEERTKSLTSYAEEAEINKIERNKSSIGVISSGIAYCYAKEALGDQASYLKLGMVWPLPENIIKDFVASVEKCYVIEELDPVIETHAKSLGLAVIGKELFSPLGEYTSNGIKKAVLGDSGAEKISGEMPALPARPPVMCAGCPHRAVFYALKSIPGLVVCGDIGCYTLGTLPPLAMMDSCVCMGASIGMALGMEKALGKEQAGKTVAVLGDSTFLHSGITGLIDIVYNKGAATVIILDNSITGMTGHQDNPATGFTIRKEPTRQLDLEKLCHAIGIDNVAIADPFDSKNFLKAVKESLGSSEPSVIIAQRPCALLKTAITSDRYQASEACIKCGICLRIACPAITKREDGKPSIDANQCSGCGFCANLCPAKAIVLK
jgi:indolepyruvate ferredoxin oxidoreductase alpha subunit